MKSILFGIATADALGVPVEFRSREELKRSPVMGMQGFGTHNQLAGTWSDDTSMSLCLADSLQKNYNLQDIANKFVQWAEEGLWTPYGRAFDIGNTTADAIRNIKRGVPVVEAGLAGEYDNGNGSLMRILPLLPFIKELPFEERSLKVKEVSSITHRHPRSILACIIYMELARYLIDHPKEEAFQLMQKELSQTDIYNKEKEHFGRILQLSYADYKHLPEPEIHSSGYVVDTLEAALWCLFSTTSYQKAVLKAINLGEDTDTTGAVTGGLAALAYGYESIPKQWIESLARKNDIEQFNIQWEARFR